jgi:class 3 adenylate cyclase
MNDPDALFGALRKSADPEVLSAIETLIRDGEDRHLCRINVLAFAAQRGLNEEKVISAFLHASRLGLFELNWNVLCPGCGGVLDSSLQLKSVHKEAYDCSLCSKAYEPTLDEMVEVAFTVNPRVRRIAAHDPHTLPVREYFRQTFWGTGIDLPETGLEQVLEEITIDSLELGPGEKGQISVQLPAEFIIVFEPVTHGVQFIDVKGEPTKERQTLSLIYEKSQAHAQTITTEMRPGPLRLALDNRSDARVLPSLWIAGHTLHDLLGKRRPFLTAKLLLTNQTFRDIYRTDTLDVDQGLKITSLTFLFTDLKGSTELYERVGDIVAYDLVREHFRVLNEIVASEAGAVVKTIGDAVMATFPSPDRALAAAIRMRESLHALKKDLLIKIGIHEGPCLAVTLNDRLDYFGQTVNIAARVQGLAHERAIFATKPVVEHPQVAKMLAAGKLVATEQLAALRGVADKMAVFQIP